MSSTEQEDDDVENNNQEICDSEYEEPAKKQINDHKVRSAVIRVGKQYQADIPKLVTTRNADLLEDKGLLIWSPPDDTDDQNINEYMEHAKTTYGYNEEQSLGMLFWHGHDTEKATQDLANFAPTSESWSMKEKIVFENAFQHYGKDFDRICELLPNKTNADLVDFYYKWKITKRSVCVKKPDKPKENISPKTPKFKKCTKTKENKTPSPDKLEISD